jgi:hypothetical protein
MLPGATPRRSFWFLRLCCARSPCRSRCSISWAASVSQMSKDAVEVHRRASGLVLLDCLLRSLNRSPQPLVLGRKPFDSFDVRRLAIIVSARRRHSGSAGARACSVGACPESSQALGELRLRICERGGIAIGAYMAARRSHQVQGPKQASSRLKGAHARPFSPAFVRKTWIAPAFRKAGATRWGVCSQASIMKTIRRVSGSTITIRSPTRK